MGDHHLQALHVGIAQRGGDDGDEQSQVVDDERKVAGPELTAFTQVQQTTDDHLAEQEGQPDIYQHERPEGEHSRQADGIGKGGLRQHERSGGQLLGEAHDRRQHNGVDEGGHSGRRGGHVAAGIHPWAHGIGQYDDGEEQGQYDDVDRIDEGLPVNGADAQLKHQAGDKQSCSYHKPLSQSPRFCPHRFRVCWMKRSFSIG